MNLGSAAGSEDRANILRRDAASWHDDDAAGGSLHETRDERQASKSRLLAARGENAIDSQADDIFKRLKRISREIEGAMKSHPQRAGELNQVARSFQINSMIRIEETEDHPIGAELFGNRNILFHYLKFDVRVTEILAAWPDHHVQSDAKMFACGFNHARARRRAAFEQIIAQLDSCCTTLLRCDGRFDGIDADF